MTPAFTNAPLSTIRTRHQHNSICIRPRIYQRPRWIASTLETPEHTTTSSTSAETLSQSPTDWKTIYNVEQIMDILPHRYPFLLIDRVVAYEHNHRAVTVKQVTINEPHFTGHFPNRPIMPGVLQVEALAQTGGIVMLQHDENPMKNKKGDFFFGGVDKIKWRRPVVPGDTLVMEMVLDSFKPKFGIAKMSGRGYVNGHLVVEGTFTLVMVVEK